MPGNAVRAAPATRTARHDQHPDADTEPLSASTITHDASTTRTADLAVIVAAEANRIEAERRDEQCRCPGRAYHAHAWELAAHLEGCRCRYAWVSVDDARAVLRRLSRRKLAALSAAAGGAA